MREPTLRTLSRWIVLACAGAALSYLAASTLVYSLVERADQRLFAYESQADARVVDLTRIVSRMGYGGMIHNFKIYVLRGGDERLRIFDMNAGAILAKIENLELRLDEENRDELATIEATVRAYMEQVDVVRRIREMDGDIEGIDAVVKIDDGPALAALESLRAAIITSGPPTKARQAYEIRLALGYGRMIHDFKNHVLRKTPRYAEGTLASGRAALDAIEAYRAMGVNAEEDAALDTVARTVNQYMRNVAVITRMASEGAGAAEIDPVVRVPDRPTLAALDVLDRAAHLDLLETRARLHSTMTFLKSGTIMMAVLVFLGMALFSYGLWWVIERMVVTPAELIAEGLGQLARGNTHVDLSAYASESEIGQIAVASRAFRTLLIDNARMTEDLRRRVEEFEQLNEKLTDLDRDHQLVRADQQELFEERRTARKDRRDLLEAIHAVIARAEKGDFTQRVIVDCDDPDIQKLADAANLLLTRIESALAELGASLEDTGDGRLVARSDSDYAGALTLMRHSVQHTLSSLSEVIDEVNSGVREIRQKTTPARDAPDADLQR